MADGYANYDFSGRVAVVTGGAGGFGRAIARRLLDSGASVALWDARDDAVQAMASELQAGDRILAQTVDITDEAAVAKAAHAVVLRFGHIDTLINNAGILGPVTNTWEHTVEQFRHVIDVNLTGAFICCRVIVPWLLKNANSPWRGRRQRGIDSGQGRHATGRGLCGFQSWPHGADQKPGQRAGANRRAGECHHACSGVDGHVP